MELVQIASSYMQLERFKIKRVTSRTQIILFAFTFLLLSSCGNKITKQNLKGGQTITFEQQLETLNSLGYKSKAEVTNEFLLNFINKELEIPNPKDSIEQSPYLVLYYALSHQDAKVEDYYLTDQYFWYVLDYFEQPVAYEYFMYRMGRITDGEIVFKDVKVEFDENNIKWINFKVNGMAKKWNIGKGDFVDDSFVQRFYHLTNELKTKGKYTYFDRGGEDFIIDFATEKEQKYFKKATGLNRIWLGEGNHFAEPEK